MSLRNAFKDFSNFLHSDTSSVALGYGDTDESDSHNPDDSQKGKPNNFAAEKHPKSLAEWPPVSKFEYKALTVRGKGFSYDVFSRISQVDASEFQTQFNQLIKELNSESSEFLHSGNVTLDPRTFVGVIHTESETPALAAFWLANPVDEAYEFLIVVAKDYQGQGIASALIEVAAKFLVDKGIKNIIVRVEANNVPVHKLIKKLQSNTSFNVRVVCDGFEQSYQFQLTD